MFSISPNNKFAIDAIIMTQWVVEELDNNTWNPVDVLLESGLDDANVTDQTPKKKKES